MLDKRLQWLALIAIVLLTFTAYSSAIRGGFIWDDDDYVTQNPLLTGPHGLWRIWSTTESPQYYPMVFTTFWMERRLWGLNPMGYHAVNVFLHAINAILVWWLLRRLEVPGAWMIGAIFAVHPVHVESVAWISERKNVLSGLFYLLAMVCYLQFQTERRSVWYAGALGLFILALLSKTVTATLPVALLLVRWLRGWRIGWREVMELVPFLMIGAVMGLLTKWYEVHVVGAQGLDWNLSLGERLLVAGRALAFYVMKLVWPTNLTFSYPRWQPDIQDPTQWMWVLGVGLAGLVFWWKRQAWSRGPFVCIAFFSVSLAPALGFANVFPMRYSFVADHFQYLASLGMIALVIGSLAWGFDRWIKPDTPGNGRILNWMRSVLGFLVLVILVSLTWKQGQIYHDLKTLWQDTLNKNPNSWLAHTGLGDVLARQGNLDQAMEHFRLSLQINPKNEYAHYNLGVIMARQGRQTEAIQHYQRALQIRPIYPDALTNLGVVMADQGRLEEAIQLYQSALRFKPSDPDTHNNLGVVLLNSNRVGEAIKHFQEALKSHADHADTHNNLGIALARQGRLEEAIQHFQDAIRIRPGFSEAKANLANALSLRSKQDKTHGGSP
jgi:tetratricopeptide (TPR) repeat protein